MTYLLLEDSVVMGKQDQVVSVEMSNEAVILNLKSGVYYGLDVIGARIWELIQQPIKVNNLIAILLDEYDIKAGQCLTDVLNLLSQLAENDLIEVKNGAAS